MAFVIKDHVREVSTTTGTGAIALGGSPTTAYQPFSSVMSIGDTCWYAIVLPGTSWETGLGTYTALNTLTRTTVFESSNAGSLVTFGAGSKDVFISLPASKANVQNNTFPSGTLMLFQQTAAPVYWTKQVTHNDKALRVVSGTASSGGTNSFSSQFNTTIAVSSNSLSTAQLAAHDHSYSRAINLGGAAGGGGLSPFYGYDTPQTGSAGSGSTHNHTVNLAIQYVDLILASKD